MICGSWHGLLATAEPEHLAREALVERDEAPGRVRVELLETGRHVGESGEAILMHVKVVERGEVELDHVHLHTASSADEKQSRLQPHTQGIDMDMGLQAAGLTITMTSSAPNEMFCRMRSLYHGTDGRVIDCAAAMKPSSWLSIRMAWLVKRRRNRRRWRQLNRAPEAVAVGPMTWSPPLDSAEPPGAARRSPEEAQGPKPGTAMAGGRLIVLGWR